MKTLFLRKNTFEITEEVSEWIIKQGYTKVKIERDYNNSIDNLPDTIRTIYFNSKSFDKKINKWPNQLQKLIINTTSQYIFDSFPQTIKYLKLYRYNDNYPELPIQLRTLSLHELSSDKSFDLLVNLYFLEILSSNIKINNFPPNLKQFYVYDYNFTIENLPKNITHLKCPIIENNTILPEKLVHLGCDIKCEHPFGFLPKKLQLLEWTWDFDVEFEYKFLPQLPNSLHSLKLINSFEFDYKLVYPSKLRKLIFEDSNHNLINLPDSLRELSITYSDSRDFISIHPIILPEKLKELFIDKDNVEIVNFPSTLINIHIGTNNKILSPEFIFPSKLKYLSVCSIDFLNYNNTIPLTLTNLEIRKLEEDNQETNQETNNFDENIMEKIPKSVKILEVYHKDSYNYSLLPQNVSTLILNLRDEIDIGTIPNNIKTLIIHAQCKNIFIENLNYGLKELYINAGSINDSIFDNLPETIQVLDIQLLKSKTTLSNLPNGLKKLRGDFGNKSQFNKLIEKLPESLVKLLIRFGKYGYDKLYDINYDNLPNSIKEINFL
jgi:hypothetical protein